MSARSRNSSVDSRSDKTGRGASQERKEVNKPSEKPISARQRGIDWANNQKAKSAQSSARSSKQNSTDISVASSTVPSTGDNTPDVAERPKSTVDAQDLTSRLESVQTNGAVTKGPSTSLKGATKGLIAGNSFTKRKESTDGKIEAQSKPPSPTPTADAAVTKGSSVTLKGTSKSLIAAKSFTKGKESTDGNRSDDEAHETSRLIQTATNAIGGVVPSIPQAVVAENAVEFTDIKAEADKQAGKGNGFRAAASDVQTVHRLAKYKASENATSSEDEDKPTTAPAPAARRGFAAAAGNVINVGRLQNQPTPPNDEGKTNAAPAATARRGFAAAAGNVINVGRLQNQPTEPIKEDTETNRSSNSVPVERQEPLLALENGSPEDDNTRGQPRTHVTHEPWSDSDDEDSHQPRPKAPTGRRSDSSTSTTDTLDPDADGWNFPIPENSGPGTANSSRPGTANGSRPLQPPEGGLGFDKSDNNRPGMANSSRQPSTHRVAMPVRTKRNVSSDFAKQNQTIKKTNQEAHQQVLKTNYDVNFANPDMSDDRYGEVQFQSCCLYVTLNFLVCLLCILGSVAWLNVDVQGVGRDATVRKNLVYSGCIGGAGDCKEMHKTHQCVHAFAAERYPHAETVSVQTPFLAVTMMTKDQTLRNMRNVSAVVVAARGTAYTVHDMSVQNAELQASYALNPVTANGIISAFHTEAFCPTMQSTGQAEACAAWLARVEPLDKDKRAEWEVFKKDNTGCGEYNTTYTRNADYARSICKSMRTPRMAVTQIQNDMYNLFSAQNEMSLVVCWNATVLVFSFMIILYVLIDHYKQTYTLAATTPTQGYEWPRLSGMFHILATIAAVISLGATLAFTTQRNAANSTMYKDTLLPTGSIMITVISGGISCLLVFVSPLYVEGYVAPDVPSDLEGNTKFGLMHQWRVHTSITFARYGRFLLSRNDLCIAYCNFLTFPILVLLIYVRYNWYSIDVQVQRAFFSAVAVGVLNIIEVSVMGVVFLTTEIDNFNYRRKFLLKYDEGASTPLLRFRLHHSNLVNIASQLVFFLSKMAVFIPTLRQIRHHTKWQYTDDKPEQFQGQNNASQPLVLVTTVFFVMNHVVPLLHNLVVNAGIDTLHYGMFLNKFRTMNAKLVAFTVMNIAVAIVINFQGQ